MLFQLKFKVLLLLVSCVHTLANPFPLPSEDSAVTVFVKSVNVSRTSTAHVSTLPKASSRTTMAVHPSIQHDFFWTILLIQVKACNHYHLFIRQRDDNRDPSPFLHDKVGWHNGHGGYYNLWIRHSHSSSSMANDTQTYVQEKDDLALGTALILESSLAKSKTRTVRSTGVRGPSSAVSNTTLAMTVTKSTSSATKTVVPTRTLVVHSSD